jgi:beta-glucosidase
VAGIKNGSVSEARVRESARRIVAAQLNIAEPSKLPLPLAMQSRSIRNPDTKTVIRTVGARSIVLLKNKGNALPLKNPKNIGVFGTNAINSGAGPTWLEDVAAFLGDTYPGHLVTGGGSGSSSSPYIVSPLDALSRMSAETAAFDVKYIANNNWTVIPSGFVPLSDPIPAISQWAEYSDTCLVFINAYSKEGADREELSDIEQDNMVKNVAKYSNNTIVIMNTVGARIVDAWIDHPNVTVS